jgi:hypothetical protein
LEKNKKNSVFKKIRKYTIRIIIALVVFVLLLSIALSLPVVQTKMAQYATNQLNKEYGTNISIDEVAITFFGGVKLKQVLVLDQHKDTLIYSKRIHTSILDFKQLIEGRLLFGDIRFDNLFLNIIHYKKEPETNFDLFVAAFDDGKPGSGKFLFKSANIYIKESRFKMTDYNRKQPKDVDFTKLNAHLKDFKIKGPNVTSLIKEMSFKDHRGLLVENLTAGFSYTKKNIKLDALELTTKESLLRGKVTLKYSIENKDFSNFNNKVIFIADIDNSTISSNDIRYFYEEMGVNQYFEISTKLKGTLNDFYLNNLKLVDKNNSLIDGDVHFKNLFPRSPGAFYMEGDFNRVTSNYKDLVRLIPLVLGTKLPSSMLKLGQFSFAGRTALTERYIDADFVMNTALGIVESDLLITNLDKIDNATYKGNLILEKFEIGKLLNQKGLGAVSFNMDIDGNGFTRKNLNTKFLGEINKIRYNNYTYSNIVVDCFLKATVFNGQFYVNDPNLFMDFSGILDFGKKEKIIDFSSKIDYANLNKLQFVSDSISIFKGEIKIQTVGNSIDNFRGDIYLENASYQNKKGLYFIDYLNINSTFDQLGERTLQVIAPDIIDGKIIGKFEFNQLKPIVENSLGSLYANYKPNKIKKGQYISFDFSLQSKIVEIFYPEISLSSNTNLKGKISSNTDDFKIDFKSPQVIAFENTFDNIVLEVDNQNPLYTSYIQIDSIKTKRYKVRDFSLINTFVKDTLKFRSEFKGGNEGQDFYNLNFFHTINKENKNVVGFNKSELQFKDYLWYLNEDDDEKNRIVFDKQLHNFQFDDITISHNDESMVLFGLLDGKDNKDLHLRFYNVNLNKVTPDVEKFNFEGELNGEVNLKQQASVFQPTSTVTIENFVLNDNELGKLNLNIKGDETFSKFYLDSNLENENFESFNAEGFLEIVDNKTLLDIDLRFDQFNLGVLNKIGGDVIHNIRGFASGTARIDGNVNDLDYNGRLFISEAGLMIPYLNTDYLFANRSVVDITENKFIVRGTAITDTKFGTKGTIEGYIKHKQFGDWELDLDIQSNRLLALNTKDHEDAAYFGVAYMNGEAKITGPTSGLLISVNARSAQGTDIKIPINDTETVSESDFITFKSNKEVSSTKQEASYKGLELDFDFEITNNAIIEVILNRESGHGMRGKGNGTLLFRINTTGKFEMWGDFIADEGVYNFKYGGLLDKKFTVKKGGTITWNGNPLAATLNLEAIYSVIGGANPAVLIENPSFNRNVPVDIVIGVKGNLNSPEPDFNILFPNVGTALKSELQYRLDDKDQRQTQALYLLSTGQFLSVAGSNQGALTNSLFETARSLFGDILNDEDGKLTLTPSFNAADRRPGFESDGRVGLNITSKINERISINGQVGVPIGGINESTVVGNVEILYRVNEDGTLNLKMFNKENDIAFIGQGIGYTQGLGISYEVDFDTFKELINKVFKKPIINSIEKQNEHHEDNSLGESYSFKKDKKDDKKANKKEEEKKATDDIQNKQAIPTED